MRAKILLYFSCFLLKTATAQLAFKDLPVHWQMIPRAADNRGHFRVSGNCTNTKISAVRISIRLNSNLSFIYDKLIPLENGGFSADLSIPSALADYNLAVYSVDNTNKEVLEREVKELVAGDYFIVTGQSNATGAMGFSDGASEDSIYANKYCRTIGTMFQKAVTLNANTHQPDFTLEQDCEYLKPSSIYYASDTIGCVGIWPLRVMNQVVKTMGIPICLLNGAMGSTELSYHFATHTPSDPNNLQVTQDSANHLFPSSYDRLFKKLYSHNAAEGIKAIFWYQGESDAVLSKQEAETYNERFARLRQSWKSDYPGLEKIFVFQINTGCGGEHVSIIREQQRELALQFNDVIVMPTVGSVQEDRAEDGCHYSKKGYQKLGENMAPAVLKYLYNVNLDKDLIMGPNIQKAYYSNRNEICLEFDIEVSIRQSQYFSHPNEGTTYLKDYFYKKDKRPLNLKSIRAEGKHIYLEPADSLVEITELTYLPDIFSKLLTIYMGPWILNKNNESLGALSFYNFTVQPFTSGFWSQLDDSLIVYPNPVKDFLVVRTKDKTILTKLILQDVSGKKILEITDTEKSGSSIDLRGLQSGLYFLTCYSSKGILKRKIILSR